MRAHRPTGLKCFFAAWIFAWVVAIYVPSAVIALGGLSPLAENRSFPAAVLAIADEVAPAAKIGFAVLLAAFLFAARKTVALRRPVALAADILFACLAMFLTLALLPAEWSRGFGIGIDGTRFDPKATLIYLAGGALAGLTFSLSEAKCLARGRQREPHS